MKLLKKWVAGAALASSGLLASAPASADVVMMFFDGSNTSLAAVNFNVADPTDINALSFGGDINGWRISGSISGTSDSSMGTLTLSVGTAAYRGYTTALAGNFNFSNSGAGSVVGYQGSGILQNPNGTILSGTSFTSGSVLSTGYTGATTVANSVLKIKIIDTNFLTVPPIGPGSVITTDSFFTNNNILDTLKGQNINVQVGSKINGTNVAYSAGTLIGAPNGPVVSTSYPAGSFPANFTPSVDINGKIPQGARGGTNLLLTSFAPLGPTTPFLLNTQVDLIDTNHSKVTFSLQDKVTVSIPEPGTLALLGLSLLGAGYVSRRKKVATV